MKNYENVDREYQKKEIRIGELRSIFHSDQRKKTRTPNLNLDSVDSMTFNKIMKVEKRLANMIKVQCDQNKSIFKMLYYRV